MEDTQDTLLRKTLKIYCAYTVHPCMHTSLPLAAFCVRMSRKMGTTSATRSTRIARIAEASIGTTR
jgi:hypothetical protein